MARKGLTLLELLAAIAVLAVLLALAAPALLTTKDAAREARCLAALRSIGQVTLVWANDHKDQFPHVGMPGQLYNAYTDEDSGQAINWFDNSWAWTIALRGYLPHREMICPYHPSQEHLEGGDGYGTNYQLASALFTNWEIWKEYEPATSPDQLRPVRAAEVSHPSSKAMYVEQIPFHLAGFEHGAYVAATASGFSQLRHGLTTVLVDGSARAPAINTLALGPLAPVELVPNLTQQQIENWDGFPGSFPLTTTRDGFLGRDFQ